MHTTSLACMTHSRQQVAHVRLKMGAQLLNLASSEVSNVSAPQDLAELVSSTERVSFIHRCNFE